MIMIWLLSRIDLGLNSPKKLIIIASKGAVAVCNGCSRAGGDIFFLVISVLDLESVY